MKFKNVVLLGSILLLFQTEIKAQWSNCPIINYRNWNAVSILDNQTAVLAGGNRTNDSIRDIMTTYDAAASWNYVHDAIKPWFKSIYFPSQALGFAVGFDGTITRTHNLGTTWDSLSAPGTTAARDFYSVFFIDANTGYVAGGNRGDSIQTIIKTIDGGDTWAIQRDTIGHIITSIYFVDATTGFAVGNNGTVLKTTDGGTNWSVISLAGNIANRNYNAVYFLNTTTGFAVGGYPANDSIQTIIKTVDGGTNWTVVIDNLGQMLNSMDFATNSKAYVVGNYGTVLSSSDGGDTWIPETVPSGGVLDTMDLNTVNFFNLDFGIAAGKFGKIMRYISAVPTVTSVQTLQATKVSTSSAQLNMMANANGFSSTLGFEYGTTTALGNEVQLTGTISGSNNTFDSIQLSGLTPNTFYYYRAKGANTNGTGYGTIKMFYTSDCEVPNCDFELWDTLYFEKPSVWNMAGVAHQVPSYNGSIAVELGYPGTAVILADISNEFPTGGIPFNAKPDSVKMYAKYNVEPTDSALIIMFFKKNGNIIEQIVLPISGNSGGNFVPLAFAINYTDTITPDSLMIGVTSTNVFSNDGDGAHASTITIDDISFVGTNILLPNWDFEQWDTLTSIRPTGWYSNDYENSVSSTFIKQDTSCVTGTLALRLNLGQARGRTIQVGDTSDWNVPHFAVGGKHQTLNFYLKYLQNATDSFIISLEMYHNDSVIGYAYFLVDTPVLSYTPYSVDIQYNFTTLIPDSASIHLNLGSQTSAGSTVFIDNISFDGFRYTGLQNVDSHNERLLLFPNPTENYFIFGGAGSKIERAEMFDYTGKLIKVVSNVNSNQQIDISNLSNGLYLVKAYTKEQTQTLKLVVQH